MSSLTETPPLGVIRVSRVWIVLDAWQRPLVAIGPWQPSTPGSDRPLAAIDPWQWSTPGSGRPLAVIDPWQRSSPGSDPQCCTCTCTVMFVTDSPTLTYEPPEYRIHNIGETINLKCSATGTLPMTLTWQKDGKSVRETERIRLDGPHLWVCWFSSNN